MEDCKVYMAGTGSYLPAQIITNDDMAESVGLTPAGIEKRTGIMERRRAGIEEATSDLASHAAASALNSAGIGAEDVDLIIVSTTSPDMFFPATACFVQKNIGAGKAAAFDINASCAGFLYALNIGEGFIKNGQAGTALVIASEIKSRFLNPGEKDTAIIFGDGAGAVVLQKTEPLSRTAANSDKAGIPSGIIGTWLYADGTKWPWIYLPAGGSRMPTTPSSIASGLHTMKMQGEKVYRAAIKTLERVVVDTVKKCNLRIEDIDTFIFHQANLRIVRQLIKRLCIPADKVPLSLTLTGNTSSASIPITLDQTVRKGIIQKGNLVLMASFGGGLAWGSSIMRW